jgi:hypothetical protein
LDYKLKMRNSILLIAITQLASAQQSKEPERTFGKGITAIYMGSGAATRHIDWQKFKKETIDYKRTPFVAIGFDRCIYPYASNAYWGLGGYLSSWVAQREYEDVYNKRKNNIWSNTLIAIRASHHNTFYVRKKLDMCSGIIVGARVKYYHQKTVNEKNITASSDRTYLEPAFGITGTLRYYFYKNVGFYFDVSLGYKTDIASFGLVYKIH